MMGLVHFSLMAAALFSANDAEVASPALPAPSPLIWPDDLGQQVGALRKGLACLPSGNFMLSDIGLPQEADLRAAIPAHLSAQVQQIKVGICSAYMGIGSAPATTIKLAILWTDESSNCARLVETSTRVKKSDPRSNSLPMMMAISQSLQHYQRDAKNSADCLAES